MRGRRRPKFIVVVASDGSPAAREAVAAAAAFPWPAGAAGRIVVARGSRPRATGVAATLAAELDRGFARVAAAARRGLAHRWPQAEVQLVDRSPVDAIVEAVRRARPGAVALGWRGHGPVRRLLMGSVSRGVVRLAPCPVLVVRRRPRQIRHLVVGLDGSASARRAAAFVAALQPPPGGTVTLVTVVEREPVLSSPFLPEDVRQQLDRDAARRHARRLRAARLSLERAARPLRHAGWRVRTQVRTGTPLVDLLAAARGERADALVVGARGVTGLRRLLLGSVAEGALNHSPAPVLVVR